jgi:hypothetical protein
MDLQNNSNLTNQLEEIFDLGIEHQKFSEAEIEDAKVFNL